MNKNKNKELTPEGKQRSIDDKYEIIMSFMNQYDPIISSLLKTLYI